jgi:plastocyanin
MSTHAKRMIPVLTILTLGVYSCGDDTTNLLPPPPPIDAPAPVVDGATDGAAPAPGGTVNVSAENSLMFSPANITIPRGTTVKWTNTGNVLHTVTSGTGSGAGGNAGAIFDSQLPAGGTFSHTFAVAGTFPYFCRIHEFMNMRGTITVTP